MNKIKEKIEQICPQNLYELGYASLSGLMNPEYKKYSFGISLLRKLDDLIIDEITNGPTKRYFDLYQQINKELNNKVYEIADILKNNNIEAYPIKPTITDNELDDTYRQTLRFSISHKMVATQSGLGWIGKTDLLVSKRFGPRIRLASVLHNEAISDIGIPINKSKCGKCTICVDSCPPSAATGKLWSYQIDRDEFYNPFKCREFCRSISNKNINKKISLCGICISVCPLGERKIAKKLHPTADIQNCFCSF